MSRPGRIYQRFLANRNGTLPAAEREKMMGAVELGFWTTVVLEAAEQSLLAGERSANGTVHGKAMCVADVVRGALGSEADAYL